MQNHIEIHKKKLCMTELEVRRSIFETNHYFDASAGSSNSSFIYIVQGRLTINAGAKKLALTCGDLFYIPEGVHYTAIWEGDPHVEYYNLNVVSNSYDSSLSSGGFALQKISELSTLETLDAIKQIFTLMQTEERVKKIEALGLYYAFYAKALPLLAVADPEKYNPVLVKAIEYIEKNYTENFSVADLAAVCFVSESRLHHIFTEKLEITPIKYRNQLRVERAAHDLRSSTLPIESISAKHGFNSPTYFRETFKDYTGLTPKEYRKIAGKI
ncbi:MAG: helix-turn-helix transcriptional regulator [Clostridia bacterium]|nr:helix-turn-helix transcriptional regulator [Clostridia bacterium]